jgi:alpha/beta superfamily hydrolase
LLDIPSGSPRASVVFAHPLPTEGGTMHTKVVFQAAKALMRLGCVVLRFNFRGVGLSAGTWDNGRGELDDYRAALAYMAEAYPGLEIWAAGFSFGAYVAATVGADDARVCALIAIAPPVHKFIIHGGHDELISIKLARYFYAQLQEPKEFVEIDRADHLFDGQTTEVGEALTDLLEDFSCTTP